jgi:FtsZ-interacting cell division protein ZipA
MSTLGWLLIVGFFALVVILCLGYWCFRYRLLKSMIDDDRKRYY